MADSDEIDDRLEEETPPIVADTNFDDAGELDYEPSEPSANSIKDAVSDDEEEGEAGDSDHEDERQFSRRSNRDSDSKRNPYDGRDISIGMEELSGPEEGEVDELEEGEVKESDDEADDSGKEKRRSKSASEEDGEDESDEEENKSKGRQGNRSESKNQQGDESQRPQQKRIPITAPSPNSSADGNAKNSSQGEADGGVCKFYVRGQCTWGSFCKYQHPAGDRPPIEAEKIRPPPPVISGPPVPLMALKAELPPPPPQMSLSVSMRSRSPPPESAWERGLKQARERIKRATEQKEIDPDFEHKRLTMPLDTRVLALDEAQLPMIMDQQSSGYRPAPRPLMPELDRPMDSTARQQYGRESYDAVGGGNRMGYERRQPVSSERDSMEQAYLRAQQATGPRRGNPQQGRYGVQRRDYASGGQPTTPRDRQQFGRSDYPPAPLGAQRASQESSNQPYFQRHHSTSSSVDDYNGSQQQQNRRVGERPNEFEGDGREQNRRMEADSQGWEYRKSQSPYYRDRDPDYDRSQDANAGRRSLDNDQRSQGSDVRRPPMPQQNYQSRMGNRAGPNDGQNPQQQQQQQQPQQQQRQLPPNYHYYRTLHQQQQYQSRDKNRANDQERKPVGDHNKERERQPQRNNTGRHEYNFHFYNTRDRQQNPTPGASGRPLPYERPSYTRQDHRGQWRDPWRRSTSPGGRRGTEQRHSSQSKRTSSRGENRSGTASPVQDEGFEKRRRRRSGSSSASGGSSGRSSRSKSSDGSLRNSRIPKEGRRPESGQQSGHGSGRKEAVSVRKRSAASSRASGGSPRRVDQQRHTSGSPVDNGRGSRYDHYKRASIDRSPQRAGRRDSSDVATRAAAKALGPHYGRGASPYDDESPRYRRGQSGSIGDRHSSNGSRHSAQEPMQEHRHQNTTPSKKVMETKPLSPPPEPPPVFASATLRAGGKGSKFKHGLTQRSEEPRKPISMTIKAQSKVKTNIYETSPDANDDSALDLSDKTDHHPPEEIVSPGGTPDSDGEPVSKRMKADSESGSGGESRVMSRREELLRQLRAVEHAIDAKRKKGK